MRRSFWLSVCVAAFLVSGLGDFGHAAEKQLKSGIDRANFDTSVKPGDDFFRYVNGKWIDANPCPEEYTRWGAFNKLHDDNLNALHTILEELTRRTTPLTDNERKLRDYYVTAMDTAKLKSLGMTALKPDLEALNKIGSPADLLRYLGQQHRIGVGGVFGFWISQDEKMSTRYVCHLSQGGLGLPERDYYLGESADSQRIRQQYRTHVEKMLVLLGDEPAVAAKAADTVLRVETKLAEASRTPVQLRDSEANYNKKTVAELKKLTPNLPWAEYLAAVGADQIDDLVVGQPEFLEKLNELIKSVPLADWQAYLHWHLVSSLAACLTEESEQENYAFYEETLRGAKKMQPRWKRVVRAIDHQMGEALGQLFVEKYFSPAAKQRMDTLVKNLMLAYRERIETREWMGPETKKQALEKLATVMTKIGYPDKWRDYSALQVRTNSYVENTRLMADYHWRYQLARLNKPVDRTEWGMSPPTVNAYYNPSLNEIVFPAGILQPPFFNVEAEDAVNYGGIGAVIGHEISHGFDDQGSRYDAFGNLRSWWTPQDRERFNAKTEKLVKQYADCVALDDLRINGRLTLGENIADLGGVAIALAAYQKSLNGAPPPVIDELTAAQRFFIGYSQVWRGTTREAEQRVRLRTDPHSPPKFRVLVPLSNIPAFYEAFDIKAGSQMFRPMSERLEIW